VMLRQPGPQPSIYTIAAVGDPLVESSTWKLSDAELNYLTATRHELHDAWGVVLVLKYNDGYLTGNLLRTDENSRAYPLGGSITPNAGDMIKFALDDAHYPSGAWDTTLETNGYCGGNQVWANWRSSESHKFRWTSAGGCAYVDGVVNGFVGEGMPYHRIYAWAR
jgi:hypothetical protein